MLKVISGKFKGQKLIWHPLPGTRPMMQRIKESIFGSLFNQIKGSVVLDLFAGFGTMGIEAISLGAAKVISVDNSKEAIKFIWKNVSKFQISNLDVIRSDALLFLKSASGMEFDLIFLDPPFAEKKLGEKCLYLISKNKLLKRNGLIFFRTNYKQNKIPNIELPSGLILVKSKRYGENLVLQISNNI